MTFDKFDTFDKISEFFIKSGLKWLAIVVQQRPKLMHSLML
jgi:hypothetical protein